MEPPPGHIYTLNSGIESLGNSAHHRDLSAGSRGGLYDPKTFHQTLSSATDFDCGKDMELDDTPYCYKRPNGSVDLYEEVDRNPCRQFCRTWKGAITKASLTLAVILYAMLGGIMFSVMETNEDSRHNAYVERWRNDTAILLATELRQLKPYEDLWAKTIYTYLGTFERDLMKAYQRGYRRFNDPMRGKQWTFGGGLAFSISAMTGTVYGSSSPNSPAGRVLFPIYAVLGIPLTFFWLVIAGSVLADGWTFMVLRLCCCLTRPSTPRKICPLHQSSLQLDERNLSTSLRSKSALASSGSGNKGGNCATSSQHHQLYGKSSLPRTMNSANNDARMLQHGGGTLDYCRNERCALRAPQVKGNNRIPRCPVEFLVPNVEYQIVIVVFAILVFVVYFVVGTAIISLRTDWTFSESLSFTVLMLTTRGVGDYEPGSGLGENDGFAMALKKDMGMVFYYLMGLCFLSTISSLIYRAITFKKKRRPKCKN